MPSASCHPHAPHRKLHAPDWFVSSLMMDRALDAVLRRVRKLDRSHDVPYLAGYSRDGKTIYIDRHLPKSFRYRGRDIEVDRYLILHEEVEKTLIDQLDLHYLHAHQIATRAEEAAVQRGGGAKAANTGWLPGQRPANAAGRTSEYGGGFPFKGGRQCPPQAVIRTPRTANCMHRTGLSPA